MIPRSDARSPGEGMVRSRLTDYELLILVATLTIGEKAHAAAIACAIEQKGRPVVASEIPAALERLERDGLVASAVAAPTPRRRSPRRIIEVTLAGLRAIEDSQRALLSLWKELPELNDELIFRDLVGEFGAGRSEAWLSYLANRV